MAGHSRSRHPVRRLAGALLPLAMMACTTTPGGAPPPTFGNVVFAGMTDRPADFCAPSDGPNCPRDLANFPKVVERGKEISVQPLGTGTCGLLTVDFGDGTPVMTVQNLPMGTASSPGLGVQHTYTGWPGRKMVRVKGITNCLGEQNKEIMVVIGPRDKGDFDLGFVPNNMVCNPVPNVPALRAGTTVKITADVMIQYGPFISFDDGGEPGVTAPADFAFPGMGKFSVIYRVGSQLVQGMGRANGFRPVVFRVAATGPLEICLNDHPMELRDNRGAGHFTIEVNETSAN